MGRVITTDFRRRDGGGTPPARRQPVGPAGPAGPPEALFSDAEIWSRDYATADGVMFGIGALSAILSRHLGQEGPWPLLLLGLLQAAQRPGKPEAGHLARSARELKDLLVGETTRENAQDFSAALLIADLIEYTPRYRATSV